MKKTGFKIGQVQPKMVRVDSRSVVQPGYLAPGETLPRVLEPAQPDVDLADWVRDNRGYVEEELDRHGGILFRGFGIDSTDTFERFASTLCSDLFNENGEHPRESVSGNVYTPTFYPPEERLLWHNENSFNQHWPLKIFFCCQTPADRGGETPIVDSRKVLERLGEEIVSPFAEKGVVYIRNYGAGVGLDWQTVFQTDDPKQVEARCEQDRIEFEWLEDGRLRTSMRRPAVTRHPRTGELSWFNQAQHWHPSCLDPETRKSLEAMFGPKEMPRNCFYGDGSEIADQVMERILEVYDELEVVFPWQSGDVLWLDNVLAAHGRNPFAGKREILVAMGEMTSFDDVRAA